MAKSKICLVTNWYPTKENPYLGLFFREQAIALAEYYDFIVLHHEIKNSKREQIAEIVQTNKEYNITEYNMTISRSKRHARWHSFFNKDISYNEYLFNIAFEQLRRENIDLFYSITAQTEAALTEKIAHFFNKPYVVSEHGSVPWPGERMTEENRKAVENADLLFLISYDKMRQIMMQGIKIPSYRYVGNLVDDSIFQYAPVKHDVITFITVGAYVFYKNYDMMIEVFKRLSNICPVPYSLIILGYKANKGYSRNAEELEKIVSESGLSDRIRLVPQVSHDQVASEYNKADAFVMTSIQEGQPVSAIEAGCCGLPIFSTRCGGVEDYVTDDIGKIMEVWDVETFANVLKDYLEKRISFDPELIREKIVSKFGRRAFTDNMRDAFDSVIGRNR